MRTITNSAGFTGATPTTQISRPLSMSVCVIVVRSHLTKNASSTLVPFERAVAPDQGQEVGDRAAHARPQRLGVGLEDHPLQAAVDRRLDEDQQPAHVDVLPVGIAGDDAAAVDADAAVVVAEVADHVDVDRIRVEDVVLLLVEDAAAGR